MASNQLGVFALFTIILVQCVVQATEWIVGDGHGWTIHEVNYTEWAKDKVFKVGDKLVFNYNTELHNVVKVSQQEYQTCTVPPLSPALPVTGRNVITLATPGQKWYICGRFTHCVDYKQKLAINVVGEWPLPLAPTPAPSSSSNRKATYVFGIVGAAIAMFLLQLTASSVS